MCCLLSSPVDNSFDRQVAVSLFIFIVMSSIVTRPGNIPRVLHGTHRSYELQALTAATSFRNHCGTPAWNVVTTTAMLLPAREAGDGSVEVQQNKARRSRRPRGDEVQLHEKGTSRQEHELTPP